MGLVHNEGKWLLPSGLGVQRKSSDESNASRNLDRKRCIPVHTGLLKADAESAFHR